MSLQRLLTKFSSSNKDKDEKYSYMKEDITIRFIRKIANPIVLLFAKVPFITPNRVTWVGYSFMVIGSLILIGVNSQNDKTIQFLMLFLVGFFYWLSALFDDVDGQLARYKGLTSKKGEWLDSVLEDAKGLPFFLALGLHIQDSNGMARLTIFDNIILEYNVWFMLFIMMGAHLWINSIAVHNTKVFNEPQVVSQGNYYLIWLFLILNALEWLLFLFTLVLIFGVLWNLIHKTFFVPLNPPNVSGEDE